MKNWKHKQKSFFCNARMDSEKADTLKHCEYEII